ncbi:hypothetical protein O6H91_01G012100 [Diphasiastrum complanatum]|nr:hypothetical protein O6H91_Y060400 [Diphasiastrum complanatum]KAJ7297382.1 hypothetical protein O6H91_Y060400 [Diphasiastrum complanatum]KAJ7567920.1 hypothetical protein O6H91_01G012100 [Diphasiastrum complanatum]
MAKKKQALAALAIAMPDSSSHSPMPLRQTPRAPLHQSAIANSAALLRIQHLFRASAWAASAVPSLGAFLGARLASTCQALALPLPNALFCKRCESVLLPGDNCSLQTKKPSREKHKTASSDPVKTERTVYKCGYCGFDNVQVENIKSFKSTNLTRTIAASKDIENSFQISPHVTPRTSTKTPDSYGHIETPPQWSARLALTDNSTGTGKKRKRKGWLTLSERTKQSHEQSPHTGKLSELAEAGMIANRTKIPRFESLESLDMQFGNRDTADVIDIVPRNIESPSSVTERRAYDLQEENPSNLAAVSFSPELLVVEPTEINFDQEMHLDQIEAYQNVSISEAIINTVNVSASDSAEPDPIYGVPSEHSSEMRSELQIEQHDPKIPRDGAFETKKVLVIDPETSEKDVAATQHDCIKPLVGYKSSGDLPEPKPLLEVTSANMPKIKEEKQMEENMHIDEVGIKTQDANSSDTLRTSDIMAVDMDLEIGDWNAICSQNDSLGNGPSCSPEEVKRLPEVSEEVLSAFEGGQLASEVKASLMGVGVQKCFALQELEAPHEALHSEGSLIETGVQCSLSSKEVEVSREALHLATPYNQRASILSRNLKRLTR